MDTRVEATARAHKLRTLETIRRAAGIIDNAGNGAHWSAREALAQADRELRLRARRNRQEPVFSLRGMENALNRNLQKQVKGPATPLDRLASAPDSAETAVRLRLAAPEVAQEVEQRTLAQEMVLIKLAALEIADEEVDGLIAEVRGK